MAFVRYVAGFLLLAAVCSAQVPEKFTNLQVLPKDIAKGDLVEMMRGFSISLGVRCSHCHDEKDFASDALEYKRTARMMLRMVAAINHEYLGKMFERPSTQVECVTCHHGISRPRTLQAVLTEEMDKTDVSSAISLYRKLRKDAYGTGQYDFSETSLNLLGESLIHHRKAKESVAIMELNLEVNNPLSNWGYSDLAMAHQQNGELQKAADDFKTILKTDPENKWAKGELDKLQNGHP